MAPGQDIVFADYQSDTGFTTKTGTSMATPITAGLIRYLRSVETGLGTPEAPKDRLLQLAHAGVVSDPKVFAQQTDLERKWSLSGTFYGLRITMYEL